MAKKKESVQKPVDMAPIVRLFSGKQVDESFRRLLARHPTVLIAKHFEYRITHEGWNAALEFAKEGVEEEFRCPNLIDIEPMRAEEVKQIYIQGMRESPIPPADKEMDAFVILIQLAGKGVIPFDVLHKVSENLGKEDFDFRARMIGYAEEAWGRLKDIQTFDKVAGELGL